MTADMLDRSSIVKPHTYPLKHTVYLRPKRRQHPDESLNKPKQGMTLIAGIKCVDGFLVAADTAITLNNAVYHGDKVFYWKGPPDRPYKLVVACAGRMSLALMAAQEIRDGIAGLPEGSTLSSMISAIKSVVQRIHETHLWPYFRDRVPDEPAYRLVIGIEIAGQFEVLNTNGEDVYEISTYSFEGSGNELAAYLGQVFLASPENRVPVFSISVAVHLAIEIFRIAKQYGSAVGLDTQIFAWRSASGNHSFTSPRANQPANSDLGAIQENIKSALWEAFENSAAPPVLFDSKLTQIDHLLRTIKKHSNEQSDWAARFVRYYLSRDGSWGVADLEPNAALSSPSSPIAPVPQP